MVREIDIIVNQGLPDQEGIYPGVGLMDKLFTKEALLDNLEEDHRILHLATHGKFVVGQPDQSFLVLGNGKKLPIPEIQNIQLGSIHLVVLSACETALGGADGEGVEVSGLSYYFLTGGAKSVLASL